MQYEKVEKPPLEETKSDPLIDLHWKNNPFNVKWKFYRRINLRIQWSYEKEKGEGRGQFCFAKFTTKLRVNGTDHKASSVCTVLMQETWELLQAPGMGFPLTSTPSRCLKKGWWAILGRRSLWTARWRRESLQEGEEPLLSNYHCLLGMCYWYTVRQLKPSPLSCSVMHQTHNFSHNKWSLLVIKLTSVDT